jgi:hypothetical protein
VGEDLSLYEVVNDPPLIRSFLSDTLMAVEVSGQDEIQLFINKSVRDIYLLSWLRDNYLVSGFIYELSKNRESIVDLGLIFFEKNKILSYLIFLMGTFLLARYLSEWRKDLPFVKRQRLVFALGSFIGINLLRVGGFIYFFSTHLSGISTCYLKAVSGLKYTSPVFYELHSLLFSLS